MRWEAQRLDLDTGALPGLELRGLLRSVRPPDFAGVVFHEVAARSALNKVPAASRMPFGWTINPMRGCLHACTYCFARPTHEYLGFDPGEDFQTQIVVKTNIVEVLRRELARPSWAREHVALGTNTDPYQRAEGRYRLMPGIIEALTASGTPLSVLTKGTLLRRDLPLLAHAAEDVEVGVAISLAIGEESLQQAIEPGTPTPRARLALITAIREAGLDCDVLVAPVMPWLTDSVDHLDDLLGRLAAAGATGVMAMPLHLRGPVRGIVMDWIAEHRPELVTKYQQLYRGSAYAPAEYRTWLRERLRPLLRRHGFAGRARHRDAGQPHEAGQHLPPQPAATPPADAPSKPIELQDTLL